MPVLYIAKFEGGRGILATRARIPGHVPGAMALMGALDASPQKSQFENGWFATITPSSEPFTDTLDFASSVAEGLDVPLVEVPQEMTPADINGYLGSQATHRLLSGR